MNHPSAVLDVSPSSPAQLLAAGARSAPSPAALVGDTPVLWIGEPFTDPGRGFWAKLEGHNPGGIKDRTALYMVRAARERGELVPGGRIVESTSGTLGLGLALAGVTYGHPVSVVTDTGMEAQVSGLLRAYGAEVHTVTEPHPVGGWQQARRERVAELLAVHPDAWCPDQYHNPDNVAAYRPLAHELIGQLGRIDTLVVSVGTGGHSAGIARVLRSFFPHLRVVGVDTCASTIFGQPAGTRLMRGLGSSIFPGNVAYELFDEIHWVAAPEAVWAARALARTRYATGGWSVGAVALVARWIARVSPAEQRIAAVFPDGPHRYVGTVFDDDWCRAHELLGHVPADDPEEITRSAEMVVERWTRCRTVENPRPASGTGADGHSLTGADR
ncbi:PLP-dependent cysteine synthase family protein [Streptomyces coelicoflavus]|jgi:cysteine synthase A|uniref:Pyridoxal-5'-phosphate-dependent protein beta subunit n=1 Tax=Streptomyces albus (strain ATCC 21838 / DSM 41398 / FERM P-419 / JCM 4703 / NBRC 107858) TaxID=1081613 RepID=A0A0B5EJH2_STRA4|nr:pyridoxal-5'-phosphate-dependent protein beta subunit [Streptomyces albus]AOU75965.1 pyridoxal-5'-phosphate-dependent protein beta subunit [Streptomyces albus]AYN31768.1 pyridoxal-5'-phosphate-dependent protein subunit beta [Streptomyces albus]MCP8706820.1 PLP-dependent cysteine synthase family protein [Streptomyces sp. AC04842]WDI21678.1 PLP-dependent cysteine synthase family protein [Streptomyces enissocaesilis]